MRSRAALFAMGWLLFWTVAAVVSPFILFEKAVDPRVSEAFLAPSGAHWFGTDHLGRDVLLRILVGSAISLGVGVAAVTIAVVLGTWVGAISGYMGGLREKALMALVDLFLCFPTIFLVLGIVAYHGGGAWNLIAILGFTGWMGTARLVRAEVLTLREREFIVAARSMGMSATRILWRHLIPNAFAPIRVSAILGLSGVILTEAGLSFLGLGIQPPVPSWGNMLMDAKPAMATAWWMAFFPGVVIFLTVLSLNVLGQELSKPRSSHA